jgi:hypothetical protein
MPVPANYSTAGYSPSGYAPAPYSYGPVYLVPSPYGWLVAPATPTPGTGRVPNPWMYSYGAPVSQPGYRQPAPARVAPRTQPAVAKQPTDTEKRVSHLSAELARVTRERDEAEAELALWTGLGVSREQIQQFQQQLAKLQAENVSLVRRNSDLDYRLSWFTGTEKEVKMPAGLTGHVMAVDKKYSFVVLNVGESQGVAKNGKLLVNRGGKLVGKVRVTRVEPNSSVANILPDWKLAEVREGDQVLH